MNKWIGMGRLTKDPNVSYVDGKDGKNIVLARYTLAVDRRYRSESGNQNADFISCVAFGKLGEFACNYLSKGMKIAVVGRIQTGSYTDKDGVKRYTTDVIVEECNFCESKGNSNNSTGQQDPINDDFMNIPDDIAEELPFN